MPDPLVPSTGLTVLHLFFAVSAASDRNAITNAVDAARRDDVQVVPVAVVGHKADLAVMALAPDLWRLRELQSDLVGAGLVLIDSYLSLTEISEYAKGAPEQMLQARLYPQLPPEGKTAWCFYPMSKRREAENWYTLDFDERNALMREHGTTGRKFSGRILQLITGSTGVDDFEWGVTLFGEKLDDLKDVVYTMRYDKASALYAEFGPFVAGAVGELAEVLDAVGVRPE